jgi:uncharacterized protein YecE (DUF72 family)
MSVLVGTSGWQYDDWRDSFYPHSLPKRAWLGHYAAHFETVEVNNTFYRLPDAKTFARWADETPRGFVVAVKVSRYLSHIKRLAEPAEPIQRFTERARALGTRLGPALLQLPPNFERDDDRLQAVLDRWPDGWRLTVEFRHPSWFHDDVYARLRARDVAMTLTDRHGPREPLVATASWGYVRLHEGTAHPRPCYGRTALHSWIERIRSSWGERDDVFVYFNNDHRACAIRNALTFRRLLGQHSRSEGRSGPGSGGARYVRRSSSPQPAISRTASESSDSHAENRAS